MENLTSSLAQDEKQRAFDARETAEMLHAAHTLLRMAFGATALIPGIAENKEEAEVITTNFENIFKRLRDSYDYYIGIYKEATPAEQV